MGAVESQKESKKNLTCGNNNTVQPDNNGH